jgi:hypothetical protein
MRNSRRVFSDRRAGGYVLRRVVIDRVSEPVPGRVSCRVATARPERGRGPGTLTEAELTRLPLAIMLGWSVWIRSGTDAS